MSAQSAEFSRAFQNPACNVSSFVPIAYSLIPNPYSLYISRFIVIKCICGFAPMRTGRPEVPTPLLTRKSTPFS